MTEFPELLLASKSPRRHQILRESGFHFVFADIQVDENFPEHLQKEEVCLYLSEKKAAHYTKPIGDYVLVTADTIVCLGNEVINKPEDADDAFRMLNKLSGNTHTVYTAVCLKTDEKIKLFYEQSEVVFHKLTDEEIWYYIENYSPFDKAGSYGVQDWMGYIGVKEIHGCFYNVMGFPVSRFYRELKSFNS